MPLVNCLINGKPQIAINIEDRALHYGDGLFETMLYRHGVIALWPQHYARLKTGCRVLDLDLIDEERLLSGLKLLTQKLKGNSYIIKLIISRGAVGRGLIMDKKSDASWIFLAYDFDIKKLDSRSSEKLKICKTQLLINKTLGGIKHLNRLLYVLAAKELDSDYSEGIMLNDKNAMIECIRHNLFFVKSNILYTPAITDCGVAGIKRQQVLDMANKLGITVNIKAILLHELKQMDECFITNAIVGLQSVDAVEHITFLQNSITQQLQNSLQ